MNRRVVETEQAVLQMTGSRRRIASGGRADACYFRSRAKPGKRKALLQITERCDLHCAHCFVSATRSGADMEYEMLRDLGIPRLVEAGVENVTLTGGEPLVHPNAVPIAQALVQAGMDVTVCTNGASLVDETIEALKTLGRVRVNVSIDGFSPESHGRFRGSKDSFMATVASARRLGEAGILKGILCTPNALADLTEYQELFAFARATGAQYLLMNPLSSFGRGYRTQRLRADDRTMDSLRSQVLQASDQGGRPEPVFIRFPNRSKPLTGCIAGEIFYIFVNGDAAICPYLVFAANNPDSRHRPEEFMFANLYRDNDFAARLEHYRFQERYEVGANETCSSCSLGGACGKGCPAAVVAAGRKIGDLDAEVCPVVAPVRVPFRVSHN